MDGVNLGRSLFTVLCFVVFVVILVGAFSRKSKKRYDEVSQAVFLDEDKPDHTDADDASKGAKQ